ncbi:MAG: hypothetical protein ACTH31_15915 [Pseudoclavibacter sp.]
MTPYLTATDLPEGTVADQVALAAANRTVAWLVRFAAYDVTDTGEPVPAVLAVLKEAALAQYAYFVETGDPSGAIQGPVSIGSLSLGSTRAGSTSGTATQRVAPGAREVLATHGLVTRVTTT